MDSLLLPYIAIEMTKVPLVEERLNEERDEFRVLSIQSHVVHGYAGNKCAIFPLQIHGFEVDFVNSVQFSNHTGYGQIRGNRLTDKDLDELFEGLKLNNITRYSHVLSGYCGDPSFLRSISNVVAELKKTNPDLIYVCDPVLGDNGEYYTPKELLPVYQESILPLADILTPNAFELGELTGRQVKNEADCLAAIKVLHETKGIRIVIVTSGIFTENKDLMYCYASEMKSPNQFVQYRFEIPLIRGVFVGTGDVFTSLLIVWHSLLGGDLRQAICNLLGSMQCLLKRTSDYAYGISSNPNAGQRELRLLQSRYDLLVPTGDIRWVEIGL
uniref:Pyridoxal kinase n=1 Tax=Acrobeloides nanus TaxID=290746 RepID=A0A914EBL1_9BILA